MSVMLYITPATLVAPTGEWTLAVWINSTAPVTGIDYTLSLTNCTLLSRDLIGSSYHDLIDAGLTGDLGASVADVRSPVAPGEHFVASYHFRVDGAGSVALVKPTAFDGTIGYSMEGPTFAEAPFDAFAGSVISVPEPQLWMGILAVWTMWKMMRRIRRSLNRRRG